jgi:CheY-like chemotaxis protein
VSIPNYAIPPRIGGGSPDRDGAELDLAAEVENLLREVTGSARLGAIELVGHVAPEVPVRVVGDPIPLRLLLASLTANALKHTTKGEVVVEAEVEARTNAQVSVRWAVRDSGRGIAPERQAKLFEPAASTGSTGLSLAAAARLVEDLGSRLTVASEAGRGSTFRFTVHFDLPTGPLTPALTPPPEWRGRAILVADDGPASRRALETLLTGWGLFPVAVDGGPAALETLEAAAKRGDTFAAVVLDARMPQTSGFAVADQLRRNPRLNAPTVVLLPASHRKGDEEYCQRLGVAAQVAKPIRRADLFRALATALAKPVAAVLVAPSRRLRVLLAGDNADVHQHAAPCLREQGHGVTIVPDGHEALRLLSAGEFDLALLDLQAPGLGGLEAVARLRGRETGDRPRLPVIALGDKPGPGDRERCLLGGFDGYVSKPVRSRELINVMNRLSQSHGPADVVSSLTAAPAFDRAAALEQLDGDEELLQELAGVFLTDCAGQVEAMRQAIAAQDAGSLCRAAHVFKGAAAAFAARGTVEAARQLEEMGRAANLTGAKEALAVLEEQVQRLRPALAILTPPLCNM